MAVCLMCAYSQTCIQQQHPPVRPRRQEASVFRRRFKGRVVFCEGDIDVLQGRRGRGRWSNGETEAVGLIDVVVGVLAKDDDFNGRERSVAGPADSN